MHPDTDTDSTFASRREVLKRAAVGSTVVGLGLPALSGTAAADRPDKVPLVGDLIPNPCTGEDMVVTRDTHRSMSTRIRTVPAVPTSRCTST